MAKRRSKPIDLGVLADSAEEALASLADHGYEAEVEKVRVLLREQARYYAEALRTSQDINHALSVQLSRKAPRASAQADG